MKVCHQYVKILLLVIFALFLVNCSSEPHVLTVGQKPPDFSLPDIDKKNTISLSDFNDKVVLIRFWTVDCTACAKEMPELEEIYQNNQDKGMSILAINVRQPEDVVKKYMSNLPTTITYPVLLDTYAKIYKKYGIVGVPTTIIVDRKGVIKEKILGEMDKNTLERLIVKML
jgi:peroxiredoxin